ncbi:MAG: hypothetical protein U1F33_07525 [Alphaproteobacteria bacterium]
MLRRTAWLLVAIGALALGACTAEDLAQMGYNAAKSSCAQARQSCSVNDESGAPVAARRYTPSP